MELKRIVIRCLVTDPENRILLIRRSETAPSRALEWDFPGGILEPGEDPLAGIIRETYEETGFTIENPRIVDAQSHIEESGDGYSIVIGYQVSMSSDEVHLSYEHDRFQWVDEQTFASLIQYDLMKRIFSAYKAGRESGT